MIDAKIAKLGKRLLPGFLYGRMAPFEFRLDQSVRNFAHTVQNRERVLDAGAGEGRFARDFRHCCYAGIDSGKGHAHWDYSRLSIFGDLHQLPFKPEAFDHVLCHAVVHHLAEPRQALREMYRVLRARGNLLLTVPRAWPTVPCPKDYVRFTAAGIEHLLKSAGFSVCSIKPVGGFFWILGRQSIECLSFCQKGWRIALFPLLAPLFAVMVPLACYYLDRIDKEKRVTPGYIVLAIK